MMARSDVLEAVVLGTEFFRRGVDALPDEALKGESLLPGWSRAHVVAHVGFNALAIGRLAQWAATGVESPMFASVEARNAEIADGALLSSDELRELFDESAVALDRYWREIPESRWEHPVRNGQGTVVPVSETLWMRAREVWIHGVDLNVGTSFADIPAAVLERILGDIKGVWQARGESSIRLRVVDAGRAYSGAADAGVQVSGSLAALTAWAAGRGSVGVSSGAWAPAAAPRWV
ncbi:maleylpyruvate isomerase family mycothiol-dependent enzyme [Cryobacterium algoritolerans]|uniref:Maleylpyruvate isomerase family mycothiol-dependent enzyme n=1 Tax=Cryobacterium algoritolerans TaxID=1259184 RepID=A0A4R8WIY0_9MICO|nr:maleylpyruvate isomerase family mycothiol-dependent enzyme [Cryobacterium algoritolerans]TFC09837.1 maleylpyruvate isomerase family mycothiol-dependent enzyme [Cryobacterium algoritolerans]